MRFTTASICAFVSSDLVGGSVPLGWTLRFQKPSSLPLPVDQDATPGSFSNTMACSCCHATCHRVTCYDNTVSGLSLLHCSVAMYCSTLPATQTLQTICLITTPTACRPHAYCISWFYHFLSSLFYVILFSVALGATSYTINVCLCMWYICHIYHRYIYIDLDTIWLSLYMCT